MIEFLAHEGHEHEAEIVQNWLQTFLDNAWYVVLPVYIAVLALIGVAAYFIFKKSMAAVYFALLLVFLIVGLVGYSYSPVISIISIAGGFALAFLTIFGGTLTKK